MTYTQDNMQRTYTHDNMQRTYKRDNVHKTNTDNIIQRRPDYNQLFRHTIMFVAST